ncbi:hypothetical protein P7D63_08670 [Enterococcus raffinosus]|uniref:hypothetical protein n=1 Tax=Enterococcus raffinosus TaxID=71452 RepID=UPI00289291D3|nr:hypothetical protein [Enterococcus raffinosus]MDT2554750.1 hypothetical protein [Enterococcus raffinosus]
MNDFLDTPSQNFLYNIIEKILRKMFERVIDEAKQKLTERAEYLDVKQLSVRYSMSIPEVEQNFVKDKRMQMIEKRKPGTYKGKRYWKADDAVKICNDIMSHWD